MIIVKKPLSDLRPVEKNVRKHSPKQISEYMRSLKMFGQLRPLIVDESGVIWIGNGMYEAMRELGWEQAECDVRDGLSDAQKKKMMMADNRIYELGMTDTDAFDEIIRSLDGDIDVPGWDADLLETLNASVSDVNAMVDSYGAYQPQDLSRYREQYRQEQPNLTLQRPSCTPQPEEQGETCQQPEAATTSPERPETRTITCPHCGSIIRIGGE